MIAVENVQSGDTKLSVRSIPIRLITIPADHRRSSPSVKEDAALQNSIKLSGVQQPVTVIPNGDRYILVKGSRRIAAAQFNGLEEIPAVVNEPPEGLSASALKAYRHRLRFILDAKRQALTPSQRAKMIKQAKKKFDMNNKQIAAMLGWDAGTMTNWLAVSRYAPAVVRAIDSGVITMHHARAFDGMKPQAQVKVLNDLKDTIADVSGQKLHRKVRRLYHPDKHPEMYVAPEKTAQKLARKSAKRQQLIKARAPISSQELDRLENDLELIQAEFESNEELMKRSEMLMARTALIHHPVMNDPELRSYVEQKWPEHLPALERFSEIR